MRIDFSCRNDLTDLKQDHQDAISQSFTLSSEIFVPPSAYITIVLSALFKVHPQTIFKVLQFMNMSTVLFFDEQAEHKDERHTATSAQNKLLRV